MHKWYKLINWNLQQKNCQKIKEQNYHTYNMHNWNKFGYGNICSKDEYIGHGQFKKSITQLQTHTHIIAGFKEGNFWKLNLLITGKKLVSSSLRGVPHPLSIRKKRKKKKSNHIFYIVRQMQRR